MYYGELCIRSLIAWCCTPQGRSFGTLIALPSGLRFLSVPEILILQTTLMPCWLPDSHRACIKMLGSSIASPHAMLGLTNALAFSYDLSGVEVQELQMSALSKRTTSQNIRWERKWGGFSCDVHCTDPDDSLGPESCHSISNGCSYLPCRAWCQCPRWFEGFAGYFDARRCLHASWWKPWCQNHCNRGWKWQTMKSSFFQMCPRLWMWTGMLSQWLRTKFSASLSSQDKVHLCSGVIMAWPLKMSRLWLITTQNPMCAPGWHFWGETSQMDDLSGCCHCHGLWICSGWSWDSGSLEFSRGWQWDVLFIELGIVERLLKISTRYCFDRCHSSLEMDDRDWFSSCRW